MRISSDTPLRAAHTDGRMHGGGDLGDPEALDRFINRLKQLREDEGRTGPFEIHAMSLDADKPDGITPSGAAGSRTRATYLTDRKTFPSPAEIWLSSDYAAMT